MNKSGEIINKVLRWSVSYKGHKDYVGGAPNVSWKDVGDCCGVSRDAAIGIYESKIGEGAPAVAMLPVITEHLDNEGML
jgi:hypothetical protein